MGQIDETSLKQLLYARYYGELEAAKRESKGYIRAQRHGSPRAYTREAWKTAQEARRQLKGFSKGDGSFERITRTKMMGKSRSSGWTRYMSRADAARLDPSDDYDMNRAGRDKHFYLTREQAEDKPVANQTLRSRAQAAIQRFHESRNDYYEDDDRDPKMKGDKRLRKDGYHVTGHDEYAHRKDMESGTARSVHSDENGPSDRVADTLNRSRWKKSRNNFGLTPEEREVGTDSLRKTYSRATPGQSNEETITELTQPSRNALTHRTTHFGRRSAGVMKRATAAAASALTARATQFAATLARRRQIQSGKRAEAEAKSKQASASFPR